MEVLKSAYFVSYLLDISANYFAGRYRGWNHKQNLPKEGGLLVTTCRHKFF